MNIRLVEKNKINLKIKSLIFLNDKDTEYINNIKKLYINDFNINKINTLNETIKNRDEEILTLKNTLSDLNSGLLDEKLNNDIKISSNNIREKYNISINKKNIKKKEKQEKKKISNDYWKKNRKIDIENKYFQKNMDKEYKRFIKKCNSIPNYMTKNLKDMPSNKGYIWKGIQFYGEKPAENKKSTVLFEKNNKKLHIHNWKLHKDFTTYTLFEKCNETKKNKTLKTFKKKNIKL